MFYDKQQKDSQKEYIKYLKIIGSLSNLFSESKVPYLYYRIAEKVFCLSFGANDLSRNDIALDASKNNIGIGLKTFLRNNDNTLQKVAEFNKDRNLYENKTPNEVVRIISELRNKRITFAENLSNVNKSYYHCVVREVNKFLIYEESMNYIDIENISNVIKKKNSIWFNDGIHEYNFNISKSTLLKRFNTSQTLQEIDIEIYENPLDEIYQCFKENQMFTEPNNLIIDSVYLPLYGKNKIVPERSGLNQWNARGRERDPNEIYIPIPSKVHKLKPSFFPSRDEPFSLHLPGGSILNAKVCQDNNKALMSNPNKALGKWLLRDVLKLKEGELLTYKRLQELGIDSIKIDKLDNNNYQINFVSIGSYENFITENMIEK